MISPESPPPWASRMSAMTAMKPMGITSQAKSGRRSHGTRKAAVRIPMKTTAATRTSRREPLGNGTRAMSTMATASRAKSGSRARMVP